MKYKVDRNTCIGCGMCAAICPSVFEMDEENIAIVTQETDAASEASAKDAMDSCPVSAISNEE